MRFSDRLLSAFSRESGIVPVGAAVREQPFRRDCLWKASPVSTCPIEANHAPDKGKPRESVGRKDVGPRQTDLGGEVDAEEIQVDPHKTAALPKMQFQAVRLFLPKDSKPAFSRGE